MPSASSSAWYFQVPGAGNQRQRGAVVVPAGVSANGIALIGKSPCEHPSPPRSAGAG
jgi:hypothetical protein